jgi:DNA polymerase-3 subunit alpha
MGIRILPPDINESEGRFNVVEEGIRFGLSAVKNVGKGAIDHIVERRAVHGRFQSLYDFTREVDLRVVNRKVMESLIRCGAFDSTGWKRSQLYQSLDRALNLAGKTQLDRQKGQTSLFDFLAEGEESSLQYYEPPEVEEYPLAELLAFEKELLGFYLTGHPLDDYAEKIRELNCSTIEELGSMGPNSRVCLAGVIGSVRNTVRRDTQERMSILTVEDVERSIEVLVFPEAHRKCSSSLVKEQAVVVVGRLQKKDVVPKIVAEDVVPIEKAERGMLEMKPGAGSDAVSPPRPAGPPKPSREEDVSRITISVDADTDEAGLLELRELLSRFPGSSPVRLILCRDNGREIVAEIESVVRVSSEAKLLRKLRGLPCVGGVRCLGKSSGEGISENFS